MGDPNDPFGDLVPQGGRTGYIPGVPKPRDPLDQRQKEINIAKGERDLATPNGEGPKQIPATAAAGIQSNLESLRAVQAARQTLEGRPESIGPGTGMLGDTFTQFNDPEGTDTRSRVGKIGAVTIHDLSGAAVSATEAPRFQPFVPTVTDRPEVAKEKLRNFEEALRAQIKESLDYYGPNNGYMPYKTPQAEQFLKGPGGRFGDGFGASNTEIRFNDDPEVPRTKRFHDELYSALADKHLKTQDDVNAWVEHFNRQNGGRFSINWKDPETRRAIDAALHGKKFGVETPSEDPRIDEEIQRRLRKGSGGTDSAVIGAVQNIPLINHIAAGADAGVRSIGGQGDFGDLYDVSLRATHGYEDALAQKHPVPYYGGMLAGGVLLPAGAARTPGQLARVGAAYGTAMGADRGNTLGESAVGGIEGGFAGGAAGYGLGRLGQAFRRTPQDVPYLVDPATGALNQPLEAMRPGQRVQAANEFGIDLPMDAAGGRTAAVIGKGLDIMPGSAGVMEDARRATEQQVAGAADSVASRFGSSRTLSEGGAELQRGASERIERGKGVISKAYNAIPIADTAPAANSNAIAALRELTGRFASNPELADAVRDPRLVTYLNAIDKGGMSWRDLKDFRTLVGEKIGDMRFGEGHSTSDLRALYGALSEDMRTTAASMGPRASRAFDRANSLNRENQQLIEGALTRILGPDGKLRPERAAAAVAAMTKGGKSTGDLKALAQIRSATVKSGAWDEIAATLIRLGGQPANSAGRDFNPQTFVNWYADMAQPARNLLFGRGELRGALDQFVAVNQRLMKVNALRNTSNTAGSMTAAGTVGVLGAAVMNPMLGVKVLMAGAGNYGMAKVWTNPGFVRWATGFAKASTPNAAKSQIGRLGKLATTNPALRGPLVNLQQALLRAMNDNAPTAGRLAASPNEGPQNQAEPY